MRYVVVTLGAIALIAVLEGIRQLVRWYDEQRRLELRRRLQAIGEDIVVEGTSLLRDRRLAHTPLLDELLRGLPGCGRIEKLLGQTDTHVTVAQVLGWSVLSACTALVAGLALHVGALLALVFAVVSVFLPTGALLVLRGRRSSKMSEQLPEALDMLARSLRAGHALSASFQVVAREMPEPVAVEFGRVYETQRLGVSLDQGLQEMAQRVPDNGDVNMLVVSATIQRETGGNLAEILSNLAETIRGRYKFQGKLKSLTAEGRASAIVVGLLPLVVVTALQVMNPKYLSPLFHEPAGRVCLGYAIASWVFGAIWLNRMSKVDF